MGSYDHACNTFFAGVLTLTKGSGPPAERLYDAWEFELSRLRPEDLPPDARSRFSALRARLNSDGGFRRTVAWLEECEIRKAMEETLCLFQEVSRTNGPVPKRFSRARPARPGQRGLTPNSTSGG